jgi:hypothetical protein
LIIFLLLRLFKVPEFVSLGFFWQEQIYTEADDAGEPGAVGHDAMGLDSMEPDG